MTLDLEKKVIIVTGAGAGIGLGILRQVLGAGATAIGFDIDEQALCCIADEGAEAVDVDVADVAGFNDALLRVREKYDRIDGLVNNAGITLDIPFLDFSIEDMERIWQINQRSVLVGCQTVARIMVADQTSGSLVNVSSNHARGSYGGFEAYAGSKGAILSLGRSMAWSLGPHGIRVNTLSPGLTMTEKVAAAAVDAHQEKIFNNWHATANVSSVEDIGNTAVFLLSDKSAAMTGAEIIADRGMSARLGSMGAES